MSDKKYKWFKIAENENELLFPANGLRIIEVNGKRITLAKYNRQLFGCAYMCPHASGILGDGYIDSTGNIVCPVHGYKFALDNGRNISGEGYYLKTYPLKKEEAGIFIGL
jgi:3-phenylpropionate/trans-cinnamate dioxygenase ferredoxin subunit